MQHRSIPVATVVEIFVGNLSVFVTERDLYELFVPFRGLRSVRLKTGRDGVANAGFGFVQFSSREEAAIALAELNGASFMGKQLRVEWCEGAPGRVGQPPNVAGQWSLSNPIQIMVSFYASMRHDMINEGVISEVMGCYGRVRNVDMKKFLVNEAGHQSGYCFVAFEYSESGLHAALHAIATLQKTSVDGVSYDCRPSSMLRSFLRVRETDQFPLLNGDTSSIFRRAVGYSSAPPPLPQYSGMSFGAERSLPSRGVPSPVDVGSLSTHAPISSMVPPSLASRITSSPAPMGNQFVTYDGERSSTIHSYPFHTHGMAGMAFPAESNSYHNGSASRIRDVDPYRPPGAYHHITQRFTPKEHPVFQRYPNYDHRGSAYPIHELPHLTASSLSDTGFSTFPPETGIQPSNPYAHTSESIESLNQRLTHPLNSLERATNSYSLPLDSFERSMDPYATVHQPASIDDKTKVNVNKAVDQSIMEERWNDSVPAVAILDERVRDQKVSQEKPFIHVDDSLNLDVAESVPKILSEEERQEDELEREFSSLIVQQPSSKIEEEVTGKVESPLLPPPPGFENETGVNE